MPTHYLGGSIMSFALPYGAFIVITLVLYYAFMRPHSVPRMKYLRPAQQSSLGTREPGSTGVITVAVASKPAVPDPAPSERASSEPAPPDPAPESSAEGEQ
jgi:hypothetical protein